MPSSTPAARWRRHGKWRPTSRCARAACSTSRCRARASFNADAKHITGVDATLALGQNTVDLRGSFGAPGERLLWKRRRPPAVGRCAATCMAPLAASGVDHRHHGRAAHHLRGRRARPGLAPKARKANTSVLHASGEAWLAGTQRRARHRRQGQRHRAAASTRPPSARRWPAASTATSTPTAASATTGAATPDLDAATIDAGRTRRCGATRAWRPTRAASPTPTSTCTSARTSSPPRAASAPGATASTGASTRRSWRCSAATSAARCAARARCPAPCAGARADRRARRPEPASCSARHQVKSLRASANLGARQRRRRRRW